MADFKAEFRMPHQKKKLEKFCEDQRYGQWWAKLLRLLTVNSLSYFVKIKY